MSKKLLSILLALVMVFSVLAVTASAADTVEATISFANKAQRTSLSSTQQVWEQNGITVTNDKGSSTSNVADYSNPARFYAKSKLTIAFPQMTKIEVTCNSSSYATALNNSAISGATKAVSGSKVTYTFASPVDSFVIASLNAQVRVNSIKVYAVAAESDCEHVWDDATCTAPKTCSQCGATDGAALGHNMADATCQAPKTCSVCGTTEGVKDFHTYVGGVCTDCNAPYVPAEGNVTASVKIVDYATAHGWVNDTKYRSLRVDSLITVGASGTDNYTGKYYTNGNNWRIYQTDSGRLTVTAAEGNNIVSVKVTYEVYNTGILTHNGENVASGTVVEVNAPSVIFAVGNTGTVTNGQVRITEIEVVYAQPEPACEHEWSDATCTAPKTCSVCGETEGDALGHDMADATCTAPKTCSVCGETEGDALGHTMSDATCQAPKTCSVCGATEGEKAGHSYVDGVCSSCGEAEAEPVASIGETTYTTLQEALNAAATGVGELTVEILKDIDLTGTDWTPVFVSGSGYPVVTVEGNGKTITGLTDMLFSGTWAGKSGLHIKNLTIKNSTIEHDVNDASGNIGVGAFIGGPGASTNNVSLTNCHLVDSTVSGGHWTGGLVGWANGYSGTDGPVFMTLTIDGCSVTGCTITGKGSAGGIIGHGAGDAWTQVIITNTTVTGNTITSTGSSTNKAGAVLGTIGAAGTETTVNGVTHTGGISVSATVSGNTVISGGTAITTIYGRQGSSTGVLNMLTGGSYDNYPVETGVSYVKLAEGYVIIETENGTFTVKSLTAENAVAAIGDTPYASLAEAIAAAQAGETVVLLDNVALTETLVIAKGANVVIDLNGYTISGVDSVAGTSAVIINKGTLEIKDSAEGGKVTTKALYPDTDWSNEEGTFPSYANNTIRNEGTFVLTSGTIENTTPAGGATYCIDNYAGSSCTINGGKVINENTLAIRLFCGNNISLTVNGGEIIGTRAIWVQLASSDSAVAPVVNVTVTGGTITRTKETDLALYSYTYGNSAANVNISISGGVFNGDIGLTGGKNKDAAETLTITGGTFTDVYSYAAAEVAAKTIAISGGTFAVEPSDCLMATGFAAVENENGTFTVKSLTAENAVAAIGDSFYATLAEAIAAAQAGDVVTLVQTPEFTGLKEVNGVQYYFADGAWSTAFTGMVLIDEVWYYIGSGVVDCNYAGMVEYEGNLFYVANGQLNTEFAGLVEYEGNWVYIAYGVKQADYTGMVLYGETWFYISNGAVDWTFTGMVEMGDNLFYVANGQLDTQFAGLIEYDSAWRYVANGVLVEGFNGLVLFNGNWYYVANGAVDWVYNGLFLSDGRWFYIANGAVDWTYSGLVDHYGTLYYVANGEMNTAFVGLVEYDGAQYYVAYGAAATGYTGLVLVDNCWYYTIDGAVTTGYTGLVTVSGNVFYVINGALDTSYVGIVEHDGQKYYIAGGMLASAYTGLALGSDNWYYVINGAVATGYTGLAYHGGNLFYINGGVLDWTYSGPACTPDGTEYQVVGGIAQIQ